MKTIAFYNEKGGVGKSSFGIMYASWLHYKMGIKSAMADFNNRIMQQRNQEIKHNKNVVLDNLWPIASATKKEIEANSSLYIELPRCKWLHDITQKKEFTDAQIMVIDLPGDTDGLEPQEIIFGKYLSMMVIPTDRDGQTVAASIYTNRILKNLNRNNIKTAAFINQIQMFAKKSEYTEIAKLFAKLDIAILPSMVQYSERMKYNKGNRVIKSTILYPDWNLPEFKGSRDLGIENLFIDITKILADAPDIPGTKPANIKEFADNLKKDNSPHALNKQINGTLFPELEIPLPDNMIDKFWKNR